MKIRRSIDSDRAAIEAIHRSAFGQDQGEEIVELVNAMFDDDSTRPLLSLVAENGVGLAGHICFNPVRI